MQSNPYTFATATPSTVLSTNLSGRLELRGDNADIVINGTSLSNTLEQIAQRLNILIPNPEIEAGWQELKVLGDQYRALEANLKAQQATWNLLQKEY